jgi:UDP-glucose 4-epimerase
MSARVLITGGAGFVGAYLTRDLVARGDEVVVFDENPNTNVLARVLPEPPDGAVTLLGGSTQNPLALLRACRSQEIDSIVHLASPLTEAIAADPPTGIAAACVGTANVFEVARLLGLRRVVWTSSITVFGRHDSSKNGPLGDDAPHSPSSLYGHSKSLCEALATDYRDRHGVDIVGLRFSILYGAWRARGLKPSFGTTDDQIWQAASGGPVIIRSPRTIINWQYVEDVADIVVRTLYAPEIGRPVYNTSGEIATFADYGARLAELVPQATVRIDEASDDVPVVPFDFDDSAFAAEVGYERRHTLAKGLEAALAIYASALGGDR